MTTERIKLLGQEVLPARVHGSQDIFTNPHFILVKPSWVADEEATTCNLCGNKFNQLRRKHHCRMCGRVLCSKCCKDKLVLPQMGLTEPERVCDRCKPVAELVSQASSKNSDLKVKSAEGIVKLAKDPEWTGKILELGGLQSLISLVVEDVPQIDDVISTGLHSLSTHPQLHTLLAESGAIKALCMCVSRAQADHTNVLVEGISALMIFCKSSQLKIKAIEDGALQPVLELCTSQDEAVALMAVSTLSLMVEHAGTHNAVIENARDALPRILSLTTSTDEQMQEVALKTLCHLSLGTDWHRHRIVQEDFTSGGNLMKALNSRPKNKQILSNAVCLVGNLATSSEDQISLFDLIESLHVLLTSQTENKPLICAISRTLANLSHHPQAVSKMLPCICDIVSKCLLSDHSETRLQGARAILHLLKHSKHTAIKELLRCGAGEFLDVLASSNDIVDSIVTSLLNRYPNRAKPL